MAEVVVKVGNLEVVSAITEGSVKSLSLIHISEPTRPY